MAMDRGRIYVQLSHILSHFRFLTILLYLQYYSLSSPTVLWGAWLGLISFCVPSELIGVHLGYALTFIYALE